jgi:Protein of unknown function (DUF3738)
MRCCVLFAIGSVAAAQSLPTFEVATVRLADRFGLVVHEEVKDAPVLALTVGSQGHKMKPPKDPDAFPVVVYGRTGIAGRPDFLRGENATMDVLAKRISDMLARGGESDRGARRVRFQVRVCAGHGRYGGRTVAHDRSSGYWLEAGRYEGACAPRGDRPRREADSELSVRGAGEDACPPCGVE